MELLSTQQKRIWYRVTTRTVVAGKVSEYVDWYHGATVEDAIAIANEDAHRYGLPKSATFTAQLATADEIPICEANA